MVRPWLTQRFPEPAWADSAEWHSISAISLIHWIPRSRHHPLTHLPVRPPHAPPRRLVLSPGRRRPPRPPGAHPPVRHADTEKLNQTRAQEMQHQVGGRLLRARETLQVLSPGGRAPGQLRAGRPLPGGSQCHRTDRHEDRPGGRAGCQPSGRAGDTRSSAQRWSWRRERPCG